MPDELRRPAAEIITLFLVEPTLREVYVEGSNDYAVVNEFLRRHASEAELYVFDERVDVSAMILTNPSGSGVRVRMVNFAFLCEAELAGTAAAACATIIVDRDWGDNTDCESLLLTDYACIEMYAWSSDALSRLATIGLRVRRAKCDLPSYMSMIERMATTLWCARLVAHRFDQGDTPPRRIDRYCNWETGEFDARAFLVGYGGKTAQAREALLEQVRNLESESDDREPRSHMNGHDVAAMLTALVRVKAGRPTSVESLEPLWMLAGGREALDAESMFITLSRRLGLSDAA